MGSVGVFDGNEGNIGELLVGPYESDTPFGLPGVGINGRSPGAVQFVVVKRMKGQQIFFGGMVEDEKAFLGFIEAGGVLLSGFSLGQIFSVSGSAKRLMIKEDCNPKREQYKGFHASHFGSR